MDFLVSQSLLHHVVGAVSNLSRLHTATRPRCLRTVLFFLSATLSGPVGLRLWIRGDSVRRHKPTSTESSVAVLRHTVRKGTSPASSSQGTSDVYTAQA